jgi:hypothetical protein
MNRSPDVELVLRDYFADDGFIAPDHVLDAVEKRIMRQPQQRTWRVLRRDVHVNSYLKPLLAVAAVVVIAVAGISFLRQPSDSDVGGAASPSPTASASPTAAPSAGAVFPQWFTEQSDGAGILPAGSVTTRDFVSGSTFSVPAGWVNDVDNSEFYRLFQDTPANEAEFARAEGPAQHIFMGIVDTPAVTPCEAVAGTHGSTAAELVDSLVANEALVTSEAMDVTLGGLTGTRVDAYVDPDWTGICTDNPDKPATNEAKDNRGRFIFLDRPSGGRILIVVESSHSADWDAFLAEAMPVVDSLQFDLGREASPS